MVAARTRPHAPPNREQGNQRPKRFLILRHRILVFVRAGCNQPWWILRLHAQCSMLSPHDAGPSRFSSHPPTTTRWRQALPGWKITDDR